MKVSIIIPIYNKKQYLTDTIESCLKQDATVLKEILLIDDHSTDGSFEIASSYAEKYPKLIHHIPNKGKGAQAARNLGFEHASGDYIQWLDADDTISPDKLSSQVHSLLHNEENSVATCVWKHIKGEQIFENESGKVLWKSYENTTDYFVDAWTSGNFLQTGCWLIPRYLVHKSGLWDESLLKNQDGEFFCRVVLKANRIVFCPEPIVYYRKPESSHISQQEHPQTARSLLNSYISYEKNILDKEDSSRTRNALYKVYITFIYQYHNRYPNLSKEAAERITSLGFHRFESGQKGVFGKLEKFVGFYNALKIRKLIKKY